MRITFKKIEIHNFKSFGDEVFDFQKQKGLNLICGKNCDIPGAKNGTGKTNLVSALVFSLFGQTQSNSRNCNIANKWLKDKEVRVATYFDVGNQHYKVVSGFNKYNNQYCELSEFEDGNEKVLTKSTMSETREYLETEILHCDLSIFMRTVLLSSDQNYNFFMLRKAEKKEFIEKLFDITVFGDMYNHMHYDINQIDKKLVMRQNKLMLLNKNNDEYENRLAKFESDKRLQLSELTSQMKLVSESVQKLKNLKLKNNSSEVERCQQMIDKVNDAHRKISDAERTTQKKFSNVELKLHKILQQKNTKQKEIDKHTILLSKLCDDCKPIFKEHYNIKTTAEDIDKLTTVEKQLEESKEQLKEKIDYFVQKENECLEKFEKLNSKIQDLTVEQNKVHNDISKLEVQQNSLEQQYAKCENTINPYTELRDQNLIELQQETKEVSEIEEKYRYLKFAETIVSQDTLRKFIISDLIGLLNNKIKTYLTKFGAKYEVVFDSDMNYKLISGNYEFDYGDFSGGERSRLMIAACFAFRDFMYVRNNFSSNILFLDEFIDGAIDSLAIENILSILSEYSEQYDQNIFIISHRKSEMDNTMFDHIIQVVKTDNISKITYLE